jgi:hypothetical protein
MLKARCQHKRPASSRGKTAFGFAQDAALTKPYVVSGLELVARNDYTKNISEYLFSPALKDRPKTAARPSSSRQSKRVEKIEREIESQKARREKLAEDL